MNEPPNPDSSVSASDENRGDPQTNRGQRLARIRALAEEQHGVLARRQLKASGWTDSQIDHEIQFDRWQKPTPGLVVLNTGELSAEQRHWIGILHAGPGAVLSHLTAARCAGLRWVGSDTIDVLTPKGDLVAPLDGYFFRQTRRPRRRYLDCVWVLPDGRVIVLEIDGGFHADVSNWWKDMKRERSIVVQGDTVLRCSTVELRLEAADILDDLRRVGVPARHRFVHAS